MLSGSAHTSSARSLHPSTGKMTHSSFCSCHLTLLYHCLSSCSQSVASDLCRSVKLKALSTCRGRRFPDSELKKRFSVMSDLGKHCKSQNQNMIEFSLTSLNSNINLLSFSLLEHRAMCSGRTFWWKWSMRFKHHCPPRMLCCYWGIWGLERAWHSPNWHNSYLLGYLGRQTKGIWV